LSDRVEKMSQAPGFYWDDKPEPHALRWVFRQPIHQPRG
jgi:hypothetical protein